MQASHGKRGGHLPSRGAVSWAEMNHYAEGQGENRYCDTDVY